MPITISLCMIVKNEEKVLGRCLDGVKGVVDEIIIADTGSTDATKQIAFEKGAKVYEYEWKDDFSDARNFSFSKATGDYITWLDADDVVLPEDRAKLLSLKKKLAAIRADVVMCPYVLGRDKDGKPLFTYFRERIFKRESNPLWQGCVHECVEPSGKIEYSEFTVTHLKPEERYTDSARNMNIYMKNVSRGYVLTARDKFYYGRELFYNKLYRQAICMLNDCLSSEGLWNVNAIEACKIAAECHAAMGDKRLALEKLFQSFIYGEPRSSVLCAIGGYLAEEKKYAEAEFWYKAAIVCRDHAKDGDFEQPETRGIIPLIQLSYCCALSGEKEDALYYHNQAKSIDPYHPSVLHNDKYFKSDNFNG